MGECGGLRVIARSGPVDNLSWFAFLRISRLALSLKGSDVVLDNLMGDLAVGGQDTSTAHLVPPYSLAESRPTVSESK